LGEPVVGGRMTAVFARALHDWYHDAFQGPLRYRDGEETETHDVAGYFESWAPDRGFFEFADGPVLDVGAGAGRQALAVQEHARVTALEPSALLGAVLRDRGVDSVVEGDMFSLREQFDRDAFRGAYAVGTQVGLAKSRPGLRAFLADLAHVTSPDATVLFDGYDPRRERTRDLIGVREDPAGERTFRVVQYEYDGTLGDPWLFRLFEPAAVREAVAESDWRVVERRQGSGDWSHTYSVTLEKPHPGERRRGQASASSP
jgi:SAM-dependent methyltransferase